MQMTDRQLGPTVDESLAIERAPVLESEHRTHALKGEFRNGQTRGMRRRFCS
jgi:hypothetical protein